MIKILTPFLLPLLLCLLPLLVHADEPTEDKLIGTVQIRTNMKLDAQARKEIAAAAAKIKKAKPGTVKLRGSYAAAATPDEYLSKSVFIAREVAQYLKTLLPPKQQIYTLFSPYSEDNRGEMSVVEILFYPRVLSEGNVEIFNVNTIGRQPIGQQPPASLAVPQAPAEQTPETVKDGGRGVPGVGARPEQPSEDARRAEDLVRRAKERAAERAKRKNEAD